MATKSMEHIYSSKPIELLCYLNKALRKVGIGENAVVSDVSDKK